MPLWRRTLRDGVDPGSREPSQRASSSSFDEGARSTAGTGGAPFGATGTNADAPVAAVAAVTVDGRRGGVGRPCGPPSSAFERTAALGFGIALAGAAVSS